MRRADRAFAVEGANLLEVAMDAGASIDSIYFAPDVYDDDHASAVLERARDAGLRTFQLQKGLMERVADTVTPQPILGIAAAVDVDFSDVALVDRIAVLIDVRDPGNLGSIVRSAHAAGMGAVVTSANSADFYNPKAVRASAGSIFRIPLVVGPSAEDLLDLVREAEFSTIGTIVDGGADYATCALSSRVALVLGNEANGLPQELAASLDVNVTIPMARDAESLNVAMAATVLMFELHRRQRVERPPGI